MQVRQAGYPHAIGRRGGLAGSAQHQIRLIRTNDLIRPDGFDVRVLRTASKYQDVAECSLLPIFKCNLTINPAVGSVCDDRAYAQVNDLGLLA